MSEMKEAIINKEYCTSNNKVQNIDLLNDDSQSFYLNDCVILNTNDTCIKNIISEIILNNKKVLVVGSKKEVLDKLYNKMSNLTKTTLYLNSDISLAGQINNAFEINSVTNIIIPNKIKFPLSLDEEAEYKNILKNYTNVKNIKTITSTIKYSRFIHNIDMYNSLRVNYDEILTLKKAHEDEKREFYLQMYKNHNYFTKLFNVKKNYSDAEQRYFLELNAHEKGVVSPVNKIIYGMKKSPVMHENYFLEVLQKVKDYNKLMYLVNGNMDLLAINKNELEMFYSLKELNESVNNLKDITMKLKEYQIQLQQYYLIVNENRQNKLNQIINDRVAKAISYSPTPLRSECGNNNSSDISKSINSSKEQFKELFSVVLATPDLLKSIYDELSDKNHFDYVIYLEASELEVNKMSHSLNLAQNIIVTSSELNLVNYSLLDINLNKIKSDIYQIKYVTQEIKDCEYLSDVSNKLKNKLGKNYSVLSNQVINNMVVDILIRENNGDILVIQLDNDKCNHIVKKEIYQKYIKEVDIEVINLWLSDYLEDEEKELKQIVDRIKVRNINNNDIMIAKEEVVEPVIDIISNDFEDVIEQLGELENTIELVELQKSLLNLIDDENKELKGETYNFDEEVINNNPGKIKLVGGTHIVNEKFPPGIYTLRTLNNEHGTYMIFNKDNPDSNSVLLKPLEKIVIDIYEGDTLVLINVVAETYIKDKKTSAQENNIDIEVINGIHYIGEDIPSGNYALSRITSTQIGKYFITNETSNKTIANKIINSEKIEILLEEGDCLVLVELKAVRTF